VAENDEAKRSADSGPEQGGAERGPEWNRGEVISEKAEPSPSGENAHHNQDRQIQSVYVEMKSIEALGVCGISGWSSCMWVAETAQRPAEEECRTRKDDKPANKSEH
jgi:hypothetical protein